jgi:hypothetical protein
MLPGLEMVSYAPNAGLELTQEPQSLSRMNLSSE